MITYDKLYEDETLVNFLEKVILGEFVNKKNNIFQSKSVGIESIIIHDANLELVFDCDDVTLHGVLINALNDNLKNFINFTWTKKKQKVSTNNQLLNHTMNTEKIKIIVKKNALINYMKTGVETQYSRIEKIIFILLFLLFVVLVMLFLHWGNYNTPTQHSS